MAACCPEPYELNADAIAALWRSLRDELRGFLARRLPTPQDADDVLQDVFLRIHETTSQPGCEDCTPAWTYTVARRAVVDFYRHRGRRPAGHAVELDEAGDLTAEDGNDVHEEVLSWLVPLIDELPERYRVPLHMADVEGRTQQEVADHLGLSLSGAKSRVQRARQQLADLLHACCEVEFGPDGRAVDYDRQDAHDTACGDGCGA